MGNDKDKSNDLTKEERIEKEVARLKRLFRDMPKTLMDKTISLIQNAAFMTITLSDLQKDINSFGVISEYQNGENQWGSKKSPEVEVYNAMIKNHMGIMKQLTDLMPEAKPEPKIKDDPFLNLVNRKNQNAKKTV